MVFLSIVFSFYLFVIFLFFLVNNPIYYCILLIISSLICSFIAYLVLGFSWYSLLLCLVYIGGVYILFIFISIFSPNNNFILNINVGNSFIYIIFCLLLVGVVLLFYNNVWVEFSSFLCNDCEGGFYIVMSLSLVFGFFILSMIMSIKLNYYR